MATEPGEVAAPEPSPELEWTGERYVPQIEGSIRLEHVHRYLIARELVGGKRVLDLGCGEGYGSEILAAAASSVIGVDIAPQVIAHASKRYVRPNLTFRVGACEAIPLPDHCVDVVVSFETVEHIAQHEVMLAQVRRVLASDGLFIISTPDRREYSEVIGNANPYHVKELSKAELEALMQAHFQHVLVLGQHIKGGSIVGPVREKANVRFLTFSASNRQADPVAGLAAPQYLLAAASDRPLPEMPSGLFDGGPFAWESDLSAISAIATAQAAEEIASRLGDNLQLGGAGVEAIRSEFIRQADRVTELAGLIPKIEEEKEQQRLRLEEEKEQQRLRLEEEKEQQRLRLEGLQENLERLQGSALASNQEATELRENLVAERLQTEELRTELKILYAATNQAQTEIRAYQSEIHVYQNSRSWRYTAPLRKILALKNARPTQERFWVRRARGKLGALPKLVTQDRESESRSPDYVPSRRSQPVETRIKLIAFYLPQFHPIAENDHWWGRGFTEWNNVVRGKPQFPGHYQPHLPGDLGFYDLRLVENQKAQIELAKLHGIYGFCFHHYWFGGRRLLRHPLDQFLANPDLDFPFCLCWANENWTRRWDGNDQEILIGQQHSPEDDIAFVQDIEHALRDPRYIRVAGRPLLIVYRAELLPDGPATAQRWRSYCRDAGIGEVFLVLTHSFESPDPMRLGFDAALEFPPNNMGLHPIPQSALPLDPGFKGLVYDYAELVEASRVREPEHYTLFRGVTPMWDNEARLPSRGRIFVNSSPAAFRDWLLRVCEWTEEYIGAQNPFVFVNAWNEWAEGAHLEPDQRYGYAYLQAAAEALNRFPNRPAKPSVVVVSHDAHFNGAQIIALALTRTLATRLGYQVEVILCGPGPLTSEFAALGTVHDFSSPTLSRDAKIEKVKQLYEEGAHQAICNTSVVGEIAELLKSAGFSVVSLIHELANLIKAYELEGSLAQIAANADRIVFPAELVRERVSSIVDLPQDQTLIAPQGLVAPNKFFGRRETARRLLRARLGLPDRTRIILTVGYADYRKGIDLFVQVGCRMLRSGDDVAFVWVGNQHEPDFSNAIASIEEGDRDRFFFPGSVRDCDTFFAGSDAYLLTSREDPFPSVVLEALDAEIPVIGFEGAGGFIELLNRGCGVLVPFGETEAMAEELIRVLGSPAERQQMAEVGRTILAEEFSFLNYTQALVAPEAPKVSVVVPNLNYSGYLSQRLKSIIDQTYPPHEVLFLDDASSDDSVQIAETMLHTSGLSYRIIVNDGRLGTYRQWLRGIQETTGDFVWIAEADDHCEPEMLGRLVSKLEQPDVVLAYCQSRQIDEDGDILAPDYLAYTDEVSTTRWKDGYVRPGREEIQDTLAVKNTIPNVSAVLMRRSTLSATVVKIEPKLISLRRAGDWLLYVHLLEQGSIAFIPDALNFHRRHKASVTLGGDGFQLMREIVLIQQDVRDRYRLTRATQLQCEASLQRTYEYLGLQSKAEESYKYNAKLQNVLWESVTHQ